MENNDKLHQCAESYARLSDYEYKICLYNNGVLIDTSVNFDVSSFLHLSGLEKLRDLPLIERNPSSNSIYEFIMSETLSYAYVCNSNSWNTTFNDPQKNGVTYTLGFMRKRTRFALSVCLIPIFK